MAQEHKLSAANPLHFAPRGAEAIVRTLTPVMEADDCRDDPGLWVLIKTKFVGYFRWTAFAMLFAPIAFWIASRR
jgi:hypothetical protein